MSLNNIKRLKAERGFTIVELLIVVVIIGILAAIVIVAYNGVTNRAKTAKSQSTASSIVKKIEAYNAENGSYPATYGALNAPSTASWYIPVGSFTQKNAAAVATTDSETTFDLFSCNAPAGSLRVRTWDWTNNTFNITYVGGCTAGATFTQINT